MATPLPPTVHGPLTPLSPALRVSSILAGARVRVVMEGKTIGELPSAPINGEAWVPLSTAPEPKRNVVATQELGGVVSAHSPFPIQVVEVPDPLPTPVVLSQLNTCMTDVWLDGLVPGATVVGDVDGVQLGKSQAAAPAGLLGSDLTVFIPSGAKLNVRQEATVQGQFRQSGTTTSLPIPQFVPPGGHRTALPPPKLKQPLYSCDTSRFVLEAVPGAVTLLTQGPRWETFFNPSPSFSVVGGMALEVGKLTVRQEMKRCQHEGTEAVIDVGPLPTPPPPIVSHEICPNLLRITASNLLPGGVLVVWHERKVGTQITSVEVGRAGIAKVVESFDLPDSLDLSDPWLEQWIVVEQSRCTTTSARSNPVRPSKATRPPPPRIVEPVYACTRHVRVEGARSGAHLHLAEGNNGYMRSDSYQAIGSSLVLKLWFPAQAGETLFVHQRGCGADWNTDPIKVRPLPDPLPRPDILEPVRPGATSVRLKGVIPGAMVHLLVNWQVRTSVECLVPDPVIPVPGPALEERQMLFAVQRLCSASSPPEGHPVIVTRGHLKLSVAPAQLARLTKGSFRIDAVDTATSALVGGQVFLNSLPVGSTGADIAYTPTATEPPPTGFVRATGYHDAPFTLALGALPWPLEIVIGSGRADLGIVPVVITHLQCAVTPKWNSGLGQTLNVPGTQNYAPVIASTKVAGPFPSDTPKTVEVTVTATIASGGGTFNGREFEPFSGQTISASYVVSYDGAGKRLSFLFRAVYAENDVESGIYGGELLFAGITNI